MHGQPGDDDASIARARYWPVKRRRDRQNMADLHCFQSCSLFSFSNCVSCAALLTKDIVVSVECRMCTGVVREVQCRVSCSSILFLNRNSVECNIAIFDIDKIT